VAVSMSVTEHGAEQAAVDLRGLGERGSDIRRTSERVRSIYRRSNERRFATEGVGSWARLADSTVERKASGGYGSRGPMVRTGALERALTSPRAAAQVDERDPTQFRFGTTLPYAGAAGAAGGHLRKLIDLTVSERREISDLIGGYIAKRRGTPW